MNELRISLGISTLSSTYGFLTWLFVYVSSRLFLVADQLAFRSVSAFAVRRPSILQLPHNSLFLSIYPGPSYAGMLSHHCMSNPRYNVHTAHIIIYVTYKPSYNK